jgi:hypothetical protein
MRLGTNATEKTVCTPSLVALSNKFPAEPGKAFPLSDV